MRNLTLSAAWMSFMPVYQHTVGVTTHAVSALALYLMVAKTPKAGQPFARYLILLQVAILSVDLNFGFLSASIGIYPVPGAICNGILCTLFGFSGHAGVVLMSFSVAYVSMCIIFCFHFKFVTILEMVKHRPVSVTPKSPF
ncbi:hypothetical protein PFISCL1PPCAC_12745, partial [Pristionchus fissidentatus]